MTKIVLASSSRFRQALLTDAGIPFSVVVPNLDERAVEAAVAGSDIGPEDLATILAEAKAKEVSDRVADALVLGCDQTLSLADEVLHKPEDMDAARRRLLYLSGKSHHLNSAIVLVQNGEVLWRHVSVATLTMRDLTPEYIGRYLSSAGADVLASVGAYQLENVGVNLFDKVEGDYFTIIGLPLLPLLAQLRSLKVIDG